MCRDQWRARSRRTYSCAPLLYNLYYRTSGFSAQFSLYGLFFVIIVLFFYYFWSESKCICCWKKLYIGFYLGLLESALFCSYFIFQGTGSADRWLIYHLAVGTQKQTSFVQLCNCHKRPKLCLGSPSAWSWITSSHLCTIRGPNTA